MTTVPASSLRLGDRNVFGELVTSIRTLPNYGITLVQFNNGETLTFDQQAPVPVRTFK